MIEVSHDSSGHRFTAQIDGYDALLEYDLSADIMRITHTRVPSAIEGRGIAGELMRVALATAAQNSWRVEPVCSYAVAYMKHHAQAVEPRQHMEDLLDEALQESFPASDSPSVGGSS